MTSPLSAPASNLDRRHALGLPAGSIRATHVLGIIGIICAILFVPTKHIDPNPIPPYLIYLCFLMLGHYFAAHGSSITTRKDASPSPWYLPGGVIRLLVVLLLAGSLGYKYWIDPQGLLQQYELSLDELKRQPLMPLLLLGGFFLGVLVRSVVGWERPPQLWQDFEAWLSIMALVGIGIAAVMHLIVDPVRLKEYVDEYSLPMGESILGAIIAFYFGERT